MQIDKATALYEATEGDTNLLSNKALGKVYDAGVKGVLTDLALAKLNILESNRQIDDTPEIKSKVEKCEAIFSRMRRIATDNPEMLQLLSDYEADRQDLENAVSEMYFVKAFIEGYQFVKLANGENEFE